MDAALLRRPDEIAGNQSIEQRHGRGAGDGDGVDKHHQHCEEAQLHDHSASKQFRTDGFLLFGSGHEAGARHAPDRGIAYQ